jgi:hypothetical protein
LRPAKSQSSQGVVLFHELVGRWTVVGVAVDQRPTEPAAANAASANLIRHTITFDDCVKQNVLSVMTCNAVHPAPLSPTKSTAAFDPVLVTS